MIRHLPDSEEAQYMINPVSCEVLCHLPIYFKRKPHIQETMQRQRIIFSKTERKKEKKSRTRPEINDHATIHSYPWTFLPSYKLGSPNSVRFCRNNLVGPQSRCSFERELDIPKYPHCFDQLQ